MKPVKDKRPREGKEEKESKKTSPYYAEMVVLADIIIDSFLESRKQNNQKASV